MPDTTSIKEWRNTLVVVSCLRSAPDNSENPVIGGFAAKFNSISRNLGGFKETFAGGAFNRARSNNWIDPEGVGVVARFNHSDDEALGTTANGTLRLGVDQIGLTYEVDIDRRSTRAMDRFYAIERGDVRQSSLAMVVEDDDWGTDDTGYPHRTVLQVRLYDVAPVVTPAYEDTTAVALRSLARKVGAPIEDVRSLAATNELAKFFKRTDGPSADTARRSAHAALAKVQNL